MATIKTAVDIDIKVDGQATVQQAAAAYEDLGDAVAKTQLEAERLALQYGINDQRTQEAIKVAAKYKNQLESLDQSIELNRSSMELLLSATNSLINGFQAAVGAAAIFGTANDDLIRQLARVQGAMAFTEAINNLRKELPKTIRGITQQFKTLNQTLTTTQKLMRGLGLGLAIAALVAIVKNFDWIVKKTQELLDKTGLTNYALKNQIKLQEQLVNDKAREITLLENQYTTEQDILEQQRSVLDERIKLADEEVKLNALRLEYAKFTKDGIEEATDAYKNSLNEQEIALQNLNNFEKQVQRERQQRQQALFQQKFDEYLQEKELSKELETLYTERNLDQYDFADGQYVKIATLGKFWRNILNEQQKDDFARQYADLQKQKEDELKLLEEAFLKELLTEETYRKRKEQLTAYYAEQERKRQLEVDLARIGEQEQFTNQSYSIYANLYEALADKQEMSSKEYFNAQKNFAIASATIDTYYAAQKAYLSQMQLTPDSPIRAAIAAAAAIASGLARVQQIRRQEYKPTGSPSSSGTSGAVPAIQTQQFQTSSLGQDFTGQTKVYVTEGDITRTINRRQTNQRVSVIGG